MTNGATAKWLMKIAQALENWPTMPRDDAGKAISTSTPTGALPYVIMELRIPEGELAAVVAALPTTTTDDFAKAAGRIHEKAGHLASTAHSN